MPQRDPRVAKYVRSRAPFARPVLIRLRKVIHGASSKLDEAIKWGMPAFLYNGRIVCGIAGFKAHCALWFWEGKAVTGKNSKDGMGNFGRITRVKDLPAAPKLKAYVKKAIRRIDAR